MRTMESRQPSVTPTDAPAPTGRPIVSVRDLSVEFLTDHGWQRVLNDVSLDLTPGKVLGVVGDVLGRGGRKPGHRLDHDGTIRRSGLRPSSSCMRYSVE